MALKLCFLLCAVLITLSRSEPTAFTNLFGASSNDVKSPPNFPLSYEVEFRYYLPYTNTFQADPIDYPVHAWIDFEDPEDEKLRIDTLGGIDKTIQTKDYEYIVNPRINETMCRKYDHTDGPIENIRLLSSEGRGLPTDMVNWTYTGLGMYDGEMVDVWSLTETLYGRDAYYNFYVSLTGEPKYLSSMGQNYFTGAHFDEYIVYFSNYKPGKPDPSVFLEPVECIDNKWNSDYNKDFVDRQGRSTMKLRMNMLVPRISQGDEEYDIFVREQGGRLHRSPADYYNRVQIYRENKEFVERANHQRKGYKMSLNRFADWTVEEYRAAMLGSKQNTEEVLEIMRKQGVKYIRRSNADLPESFSWKGTPADGIVKDQAICGSCWAFASVGAMEAAWYMATGEDLSLSEQQLCDCSWDYLNQACDGGFNFLAMLYAAAEGGMMTESMYSYIGQDDFCIFDEQYARAKFTMPGFVDDDIESVKDALVNKGPLAISIDASLQEFRFYTDGIFSEAACSKNNTNHAVVLVGYGQEDGKDYWLIRNSWSKLWGNEGYMKVDMARDCGITSNAAYAVADEEVVAEVLAKKQVESDKEKIKEKLQYPEEAYFF